MPAYSRAPVRSRNNPNLFLVILLVVFVLTTIGMGLWGWAGMADQRNTESLAKKKSEEVQSLSLAEEFYAFVAAEMRLIVGHKLSEDEKATWRTARAEFFKDKGKFEKIDPKVRKIYRDLIDQAIEALTFDEEGGKYGAEAKIDDKKDDAAEVKKDEMVWRARFIEKDEQIRKLKAELQDRDKKLAQATKLNKDLHSKYEQADRNLLQKIKEGSDAAITAATQQSDAMKESLKRNIELVNEVTKEKEQSDLRELGWFAKLKELDGKIKDFEANMRPVPAAAPVVVANINGGKGLFLDMSMGRPVYDVPVGTVVAVAGDKILIEVLPDDRAEERLKLRTKLPFNVFAGPKADAKFDRQLKATIEIVSVQEGRFAEARVTARFGDQLFNSAWGTHVAVAGQVNLFGRTRGEGQAEQTRNLKSFLAKLEDQGAIVDAYLDLTDGTIKGQYGKITDKTRFLIVGWEPDPVKGLAAARAEAPENADIKAIEALATTRIDLIKDQIKAMREEAQKRGLFLISPENFANIAGYRKIGGYAPDEIPFEPKLPMLPANK
jgi:hypothetical protein